MAWSYDNAPGTSTADARRDAVRFLTGDTNSADQQVTDEEVAFALSEASDDVYLGAVIVCRGLAAKFSGLVDTAIESVKASYSQKAQAYRELAVRLDRQAKKSGSIGLGTPLAGGLSISTMEGVEDDADRVDSAFRIRQFRNPPRWDDDDRATD